MRRAFAPILTHLVAALVPLMAACAGHQAGAPKAGAAPSPRAAPELEIAGGALSGGEIETLPTQTKEVGGERVGLRAFGTETAMRSFFASELAARRRERAVEARGRGRGVALKPPSGPAAVMAQAPKPADGAPAKESESITNTQHAGVDEGGIVKVHGQHLVVLRRGRLFTIRVGGGDLRPVFATDAFGPGVEPADTWYDEMLVVGDTIVVVGYSERRGGTEIGLFDIDAAGIVKHRSTHQLRSDDYYSSRNFASRLVGNKLVFYSPLAFDLDAPDPFASLPAARRFRPGMGRGGFKRIAAFSELFHVTGLRPEDATTLHTVTVCDLASPSFDCRATTLLGPAGRSFYVSEGAVYVWASRGDFGEGDHRSHLYRLPLDGSGPTALGVFGSPVDQFSFLEGNDGFLNVLVRAESTGDAMWGPEQRGAGAPALARVSLASFASASPEPVRYAMLPAPERGSLQNRFVGDYVLYGTGGPPAWHESNPRRDASLFAFRYASGGAASALKLGHGVERIEAMGRDAVVVGGDGSALHFSAVGLGQAPRLEGHHEIAGGAQGETRSHGFFYQPETSETGLLGLPVRGVRRPRASLSDEAPVFIQFLRNDSLHLRELGELAARSAFEDDDRCRASCVDWYGNARPIFLRGRLFALLGYELVEGRVEAGRVREIGRISFSPASRAR